MCLYNYNNKSQTSDQQNSYEYNLLNSIYKSIESNDKQNAIKLTQQLIELQSSPEKIIHLQEAINSLM